MDKANLVVPYGTREAILPPSGGMSDFALRQGQRRLVYDIHRSLALCGMHAAGEVAVITAADDGRVDVAGVYRCHSASGCPCCARRLADHRTATIEPQFRTLLDAGHEARLITLTVGHTAGWPLAVLRDVIDGAWATMTSGGGWTRFRDQHLGGKDLRLVRGHDTTHGAGGWHPHMHLLMSVPPDVDADAAAAAVAERWTDFAGRRGRCSIEAQDVAIVTSDWLHHAVQYVVSPAAIYTGNAMADRRRRRGEAIGRTPREILESAIKGDVRNRILYREYVAALKGRRQLTMTRNVRMQVECEVELPPVDDMVEISRLAHTMLHRRRLMTELVDELGRLRTAGNRRAFIHRFLSRHLADGWWIDWGGHEDIYYALVSDDNPMDDTDEWQMCHAA